MPELLQLAQETSHKELADWTYVQIAEAHAADEWPIGFCKQRNQTKTLAARVAAARDASKEFGLDAAFAHVAVSDPENSVFERLLAPWPTAWFVFERRSAGNVVLVFASEPTGQGLFDVAPLRLALSQ
jgi:hypothetical protein